MLVLLAAGCTSSPNADHSLGRSRSLVSDQADMKNYVRDGCECVQESEQQIRLGRLPLLRQRAAQRLDESSMTTRGHDLQRR